jgi:hypothetical protein
MIGWTPIAPVNDDRTFVASRSTLPAIVAEKSIALGQRVPTCPDCGSVLAAAICEPDAEALAFLSGQPIRFTYCPRCEAGLIF